MPDQRQQRRLDRIAAKNPARAERVEERMMNRERRYNNGPRTMLKKSTMNARPDIPLAPTPQPKMEQ